MRRILKKWYYSSAFFGAILEFFSNPWGKFQMFELIEFFSNPQKKSMIWENH